jgi:hypothetical protein
VYETASVEERNKPAVGLIYKDFANDARSAASGRGVPVVRLVPESIPSEWTNLQDIEAEIGSKIDDIIGGLTRPLTPEELSPRPKEAEKAARIIFKGSLAEINRFFYQRGWTDGLPIIPPTEGAVAEMLTGTDLPPDHVVALMAPRMGKATVEKIAVNAVMAGALPTYLPLLIAGVKAQTDPRTGPTGLAVSTTSIAPLWIVNGPVRQDLNINHSYGALSPGDIANASIGRALGLITKNIRGVRKGIEDMGVLGNPGRYSMLVAENEEDSPWEPLQVEHGFGKGDSTVTIGFTLSFAGLMPYGTDDQGILSTIIYNIMPQNDGGLFLMLTPPLARALAKSGWSKKSIKDYIIENATTPLLRHPRYWSALRESPEESQSWNTQEPTRILRRRQPEADPVLIFVSGGSGTRLGLFAGGPREWVTIKVDLPSGWDSIAGKYKNLVPSYLMY